jgi:23S rRNA pseudouridine2605 synthase
MRANKYIAGQTGLSRRYVDKLIEEGRITVNGQPLSLGQQLELHDTIDIKESISKQYSLTVKEQGASTSQIVLLNKPVGYVCSREGQGSKTVYDLLPTNFQKLKIGGRLDKDSSGLVLLTDDGELLNQLTHPSFEKTKIYEVILDKQLQPLHQQMISDFGIRLDDGNSKFQIEKDKDLLRITMREGRNRQIRRTFEALGYRVKKLHRTNLGIYSVLEVAPGEFSSVK